MSPTQALRLRRLDAMRVTLPNGDYAVTQRRGRWYTVSPRSGQTLATPWPTPQRALASAFSHRFVPSP